MRKSGLFVFLLLSVSLAVPHVAVTQDRDHERDLLVHDDKVQCPAATFTSIQDAINAANPGSLIRVCPGTYREELSVTKSLSIVGDNGAIVMPANMVANTISSTGSPIAADILVKDAESVERASTGLSGEGDSNVVPFPRPQPLLGNAKTLK